MSDNPAAATKPRVSVQNNRDSALVVYIEPTPERFCLAPGEKLEVFGTQNQNFGVSISAHDEGLTIWPETQGDDVTLIDGENAEDRSWVD